MKKIYIVVMLVIMGMLTGCAASPARITMGSVDNAYKLAKDDSGIVYGPFVTTQAIGVTIKNACDDIKNNDLRCSHQDDYVIGAVVPVVGFSAGSAPILTLVLKKTGINGCKYMSASNCTFLKVQAEYGKFATVVQVASVPGDEKCYWTGGGMIGSGTVCPSYKWDYSKDLRSFDAASAFTGNGVLSVTK